jgi:hypothetical protein
MLNGSARRECHVIVFNEEGLLRLMTRYCSQAYASHREPPLLSYTRLALLDPLGIGQFCRKSGHAEFLWTTGGFRYPISAISGSMLVIVSRRATIACPESPLVFSHLEGSRTGTARWDRCSLLSSRP